jgi:hypothetical protein
MYVHTLFLPFHLYIDILIRGLKTLIFYSFMTVIAVIKENVLCICRCDVISTALSHAVLKESSMKVMKQRNMKWEDM